jgi:hypothetical protein
MKPQPWDADIKELEIFFKTHKLPKGSIKLTEQVIITDVLQFLKSHFAIVREHNGNERYRPYLMRLQQLKNL